MDLWEPSFLTNLSSNHKVFSTSWGGICSQLANVAKRALVITGIDVIVPSANSLIIAWKIPGAWLVQIQP
jgi:hypothetical protein